MAGRLPKISEFFGITIYIHWRDHLPAHIHAHYAGAEARIAIESLAVLSGDLPPRATGLVREWALLHQKELRAAWLRAERLEPVPWIEPLE